MTYSSPSPPEHRTVFRVTVLWDDEAKVYVATSDDLPGLVAEAETIPLLENEMRALVPDLLALNKVAHSSRVRLDVEMKPASLAIELAA
ncbi:MAG TPA: DUF1902 domain-containing protein [Acetobacteraceae bacterium]|nr:DUF1902 domain-containing protein [Acetobacteraceae bacterium]